MELCESLGHEVVAGHQVADIIHDASWSSNSAVAVTSSRVTSPVLAFSSGSLHVSQKKGLPFIPASVPSESWKAAFYKLHTAWGT